MKLIIKEYLSSLKERDELDSILPDLISQLGLNVYSRPGRGTRQDGVDLAAVGSLDESENKVWLFSIKRGDLTRKDWDGASAQSLRPSLNEILDSYIPNRLPVEHRDKQIVICITIGGEVQEQVRSSLTGFISQNTKPDVSFEEWNGDKLADLIQSSFLREELLPKEARSRLRKSLALLDEPYASFRNFSLLIQSLSTVNDLSDHQRITAMRQMSICLWILFAWARESKNTESAYLSGEFTLLHAWNIAKLYAGTETKAARSIESAFFSIFSAYRLICRDFLETNVMPHADKRHGISSAINSSCGLDINLKLFDLLGRLAIDGLWAYWDAKRYPEEETLIQQSRLEHAQMCSSSIRSMVSNNPTLLLPNKDEHAIDLLIGAILMLLDANNSDFLKSWLSEMIERARFSLQINGKYPCILQSYSELLAHPKCNDSEYRTTATSGSILYPIIALLAALIDDASTYKKIVTLRKEFLQHCTFQFWYPDDISESHFYTNSDTHGAALSQIDWDRSMEDFMTQIFDECKHSLHFADLSAVKFGWWPLIVVACRLYRTPVPLHLLERLKLP